MQHDARHRLTGYLLARGFVDRKQRDATAAALEQALDTQGRHDRTSPQWISAAIELVEAWHDNVLEHLADDEQRDAARQWIACHLREHLAGFLHAFEHPEAFARCLSTAMQCDPAFAPPLPKAHPQDMPRQPLGELPAVMRGSFWVSTARWAMPMKSRPVADAHDLPVGDETPPH